MSYTIRALSQKQRIEIERETQRALSMPKSNLKPDKIISRLRSHYQFKVIAEYTANHYNSYWLGAALAEINAYFDSIKNIELKRQKLRGGAGALVSK